MKLLKGAIALFSAASLSGCYSLNYNVAAMPDDQVSMTRVKGAKIERTFHAEKKALFIVAGLIPLGEPNIAEAIRNEVGSRRVQAVRIHSEMSFTDGLYYVLPSALLSAVTGVIMPTNAIGAGMISGIGSLLLPQFRTIVIDGEVIGAK